MSSGAKRALGTKLKLGNAGSPESFTAVAEVISLQQSGKKVDLIDVTNMDSPASSVGLTFREFIGGLADGGEMSFTANYIPGNSSQEAFRTAFDGLLHNWQIVLPASLGTWSFAGFVSADDKDYQIDKQLTFSGKIKISGVDSFA
jgi:Lambda phage tail tube protein, TTP